MRQFCDYDHGDKTCLGPAGVSLAVGGAAIVAPTVKLRFADMIYGIQRWQR